MHTKRGRGRAAVALLLLTTVVASCQPRDVAVNQCLGGDRPIVKLTRDYTNRWPDSSLSLPDGTAIDARAATFNSTTPVGRHRMGIKIHVKDTSPGRNDLCLVGGLVYTTLDPERTDWDIWHDAYAITPEGARFHAIGTRVVNHGDAFNFTSVGASDWRLTGVAVDGMGTLPQGYAHDDCVQNDFLHSGTIVDSKFDGCFAFLSQTPDTDGIADGTGRKVEITETLVYLRPFELSYDWRDRGTYNIGHFFKHGGTDPTPRLVIRDSVFRADQDTPFGDLALPPGTTCTGVTLIGTQAWSAADLRTWTSQCTGLTLGSAQDWDQLVTTWDAEHPPLVAG